MEISLARRASRLAVPLNPGAGAVSCTVRLDISVVGGVGAGAIVVMYAGCLLMLDVDCILRVNL